LSIINLLKGGHNERIFLLIDALPTPEDALKDSEGFD
jgi:hypothetical protein